MSGATDAAAIKTAIDAKFTTPRVVDLAGAKSATKDYILLFVSRRYVADRLGSGEVTIPGGRVVVRYVCLAEANVSVMRDRARAALEDVILPGGVGPFVFESETLTDDDGTWFVGADTFTY